MDLTSAELSSPTRKRRAYFKRDFKKKLVDLCAIGDKSISAIAREHDVHVNLLFRWIREFGAVGDSNLSPQMLPVSVTDDVVHNAISADVQPYGSPSRNRTDTVDGSIVLTTRNGCSLQIIGRPDDELLRRVLQMAFA